jgi:hypothetical protein
MFEHLEITIKFRPLQDNHIAPIVDVQNIEFDTDLILIQRILKSIKDFDNEANIKSDF